MTASLVNDQLFVDVLAQIEKHPEEWSQKHFQPTGCGTAMCFAGHAVHLAGLKWTGEDDASELLGIPGFFEMDNHLFNPDNTMDDLYKISAEHLGLEVGVLREKVAATVADGATQ